MHNCPMLIDISMGLKGVKWFSIQQYTAILELTCKCWLYFCTRGSSWKSLNLHCTNIAYYTQCATTCRISQLAEATRLVSSSLQRKQHFLSNTILCQIRSIPLLTYTHHSNTSLPTYPHTQATTTYHYHLHPQKQHSNTSTQCAIWKVKTGKIIWYIDCCW